MILGVFDTLKLSGLIQDADGQLNNITSSIRTVAQENISQLVTIRLANQTKHATKSVKTRLNPQDFISKTTDQTDHQRLYTQMVEVVRRAGTGLEWDARWRSQTAPGTRGPDEMLLLAGNLANAEIAAKE